MAKTVLASEQVKKLSAENASSFNAFTLAVLPGFAKNFFVSYSPGDTGHWNSKEK